MDLQGSLVNYDSVKVRRKTAFEWPVSPDFSRIIIFLRMTKAVCFPFESGTIYSIIEFVTRGECTNEAG